MPDPPRNAFSYAIVRVVPRVERGERINVGVILYCRQRDFLKARVTLDEARLAALSSEVSPSDVRAHLDALVRVAAGDPTAGPMAALPPSDRFGWLVAPSSTIIQPSQVHTGLSSNPEQTLEDLFHELVGPAAGG